MSAPLPLQSYPPSNPNLAFQFATLPPPQGYSFAPDQQQEDQQQNQQSPYFYPQPTIAQQTGIALGTVTTDNAPDAHPVVVVPLPGGVVFPPNIFDDGRPENIEGLTISESRGSPDFYEWSNVRKNSISLAVSCIAIGVYFFLYRSEIESGEFRFGVNVVLFILVATMIVTSVASCRYIKIEFDKAHNVATYTHIRFFVIPFECSTQIPFGDFRRVSAIETGPCVVAYRCAKSTGIAFQTHSGESFMLHPIIAEEDALVEQENAWTTYFERNLGMFQVEDGV